MIDHFASQADLYPDVYDSHEGKPLLPTHLLKMSLLAARSRTSELVDAKAEVPNFRALQVKGGSVFPWTAGLDTSQLSGRIHFIVFDFVGATFVDKVSNQAAGFDVVRASMRAFVGAGQEVALKFNLRSSQRYEAEFDRPVARALCGCSAYKVGNDQVALLILDSEREPLSPASIAREVVSGFPLRLVVEAQRSRTEVSRILEEADVHMGVRWGSASVGLAQLMGDPSAPSSLVDKISLVRAGSRAKTLLARAEAACVAGPGLFATPERKPDAIEETGAGIWRHAALSIDGGAHELVGDFSAAQERSGSCSALRGRQGVGLDTL